MQKFFKNVCEMKKVIQRIKNDSFRALTHTMVICYYLAVIPLNVLALLVHKLANAFSRVSLCLHRRNQLLTSKFTF